MDSAQVRAIDRQPANTIIISGTISREIKAKEFTVLYWEDILAYTNRLFTSYKTVIVPIRDGKFRAEIHPARRGVYLDFGCGKDDYGHFSKDTYMYFGEDGDDVVLKIDTAINGYQTTFSGSGSAKFALKSELSAHEARYSKVWHLANKSRYNPDDSASWIIKKGRDFADSLMDQQLRIIEKFRNKLSLFSYQLFRADVISQVLTSNLITLSNNIGNARRSPDLHLQGSFNAGAEADITAVANHLKKLESSVNHDVLSKSAYYSLCWMYLFKTTDKLKGISDIDKMINLPDPVIRSRVLANYFISTISSKSAAFKDSVWKRSSPFLTDTFSRQSAVKYMTGTSQGAKTLDFGLPDVNGKTVKLSDFRGKVVFIDFWYVGCGGCAEYYQSVVREVEEKYWDNSDMVFIAVSIDRDITRWLKGIKSGQYTSESAINVRCPDGVNEPIIKQFAVDAYPHPLLLDRNGDIITDSMRDLRYNGVKGLTTIIEKALKEKKPSQ